MNRGYVRVSTIKQKDNGVSLQCQRETIEARAKGEVQFYQDTKTGRNDHRPGLLRLLKELKKGDIVFCYKLDRLSRSLPDTYKLMEQFKKKKVFFVSCQEAWDTSTAAGKAFMGTLAVWAQYESELISERTKAAMRTAKANGQFLGAIPFGYSKKRGKLTPIESEQDTIRYAARLKEKGLSWDKISKRLNNELKPTKLGGLWFPDVIGHIVRRDREIKELLRGRL